MDAAGVVADHPAESASAVGGRVGTECEAVCFGGVAQLIQNNSWLNPGLLLRVVEPEETVVVLGHIHDHGHIAALAGNAGAAAASKDGGAKLAADSDRPNDVF